MKLLLGDEPYGRWIFLVHQNKFTASGQCQVDVFYVHHQRRDRYTNRIPTTHNFVKQFVERLSTPQAIEFRIVACESVDEVSLAELHDPGMFGAFE